MSESERYQAYLAALNEAARVYGFQVGTHVQPEALGPVVQVRAILTISAVPNWQPPDGTASAQTPPAARQGETAA